VEDEDANETYNLFVLPMSENTKSKESHKNDLNIIRVGVEYLLKQCLYRGKQHNIYLGK
jgi:hypothetical protein